MHSHLPEIPYDYRIILQDIQQLFNLRLCELTQCWQQKVCNIGKRNVNPSMLMIDVIVEGFIRDRIGKH